MKKLILVYNWYEAYVASGTDVIPFMYASKEDAYVDFTTLLESSEDKFTFLNRDWWKHDSDNDLASCVKFYDLDEWFDQNKVL